jgi:hypothetical protein
MGPETILARVAIYSILDSSRYKLEKTAGFVNACPEGFDTKTYRVKIQSNCKLVQKNLLRARIVYIPALKDGNLIIISSQTVLMIQSH